MEMAALRWYFEEKKAIKIETIIRSNIQWRIDWSTSLDITILGSLVARRADRLLATQLRNGPEMVMDGAFGRMACRQDGARQRALISVAGSKAVPMDHGWLRGAFRVNCLGVSCEP